MTLLPLTRSGRRRQLTVERAMLFLIPQASNSSAGGPQASGQGVQSAVGGQGENVLPSAGAQFGHLLNAAFNPISANGETSEVASTAEPVVPLQQIPPEWQSAFAIAAPIPSGDVNLQTLVDSIDGHQVGGQLDDSSQLEQLSALATRLDSDAALRSVGQLPEVAIERPTLPISAAANSPNDGLQQLSIDRSAAEGLVQEAVQSAQNSEQLLGGGESDLQVDSAEQQFVPTPDVPTKAAEEVPATEDSPQSVLVAVQADHHATYVRAASALVPHSLTHTTEQFDENSIDGSTTAGHGDEHGAKTLASLPAGIASAETDPSNRGETSPGQLPSPTRFDANDPHVAPLAANTATTANIATSGGIDRAASSETSVSQQRAFSETQQASTGVIDGSTGRAVDRTHLRLHQGGASDAQSTNEAGGRNAGVKQNATVAQARSRAVAESTAATQALSAESSTSNQLVNQIASNADSPEGDLTESVPQVDRPRGLDQPSAATGGIVSDVTVSDVTASTTSVSSAIEPAPLQSSRTDTTSSIARPGNAPQSPVPGQVATAVQEAVETNVTPLRVRLDPPELGSIAVEIRRDAGQLQIEIQFESSDALRAARDGVDSLRESLSAKGIDVDAEQVRLKLEIGREPRVADASAADNEERSTGRDSQSRDQTDQQRSNENRHGFGDPSERGEAERQMTAARRFDEQSLGVADETTPTANARRRNSGNVRSLDIEI